MAKDEMESATKTKKLPKAMRKSDKSFEKKMFEKIQPEKRGPGAHTMKLMKSRSNTAKEKNNSR